MTTENTEEILITVIMPIYNAERFLKEAVDSVLNQTWRNLELLMIDDCSTDDSLSLARQYECRDSRVRVIAMEQNQGVARVRNRGIQEARGAYIALLDSDDVWLPDKLRRQMDCILKTHAEIAYCSYDMIDEMSHPIQKPFLVPARTDYRHMLVQSVISCSTALIQSSLLRAHPFSPAQYHEDFVLWLELLSDPKFIAVGCPEVLAHYRQVDGSRSHNKRNSAWKRWKVYRESLGMDPIASCWFFLWYTVYALRKYYL